MKLQEQHYPFTLLTPAMVGGAFGKDGDAEMRIASVRGQVRWWHRTANLTPAWNQVWGQTDGSVIASRVSLTMAPQLRPAHGGESILPHDLSKSGRPRDALRSNQVFTLTLCRLVGCSKNHWEAAQKAVKLWLLLGCIGLRSNRAAGSVWPVDDPNKPWVPTTVAEMKSLLPTLGLANQCIAIIGWNKGKTASELRTTASDTVSVSEVFGAIKPSRTPSPTRFKVIKLGEELCLLASAASTRTATKPTMLQRAEDLLRVKKPKPERWVALGAWNHIIP